MSEYPRRRHLRVLDVMTTEVVTANPLDGFKEVARRLYETGVSALPVVDEDRRVLGVVSEGDLLVKEGGEHKGSLLHPKKTRRLTSKAEATVAAQAMTEPAVTITADTTVAEAARMMYKKGVKRLPVVDSDGRLRGCRQSPRRDQGLRAQRRVDPGRGDRGRARARPDDRHVWRPG